MQKLQKEMRILGLIIIDITAIIISYILALQLRFNFHVSREYLLLLFNIGAPIILIKIVVLYFFGLYKSLWEFASVDELMKIVVGCLVANVFVVSYIYFVHSPIPRSVYFGAFVFDTAFIGGSRLSYRVLRNLRRRRDLLGKNYKRKAIIVGAGNAGAMVLKEYRYSKELNNNIINVVAFVDDDIKKIGSSINGINVAGNTEEIPQLVKKLEIDEIVIAIPSAPKKEISRIVEICSKTESELKILPGIYEFIDGKLDATKLREVRIEDLLGRDEVKLDNDKISSYIEEKVVLVTGGGGSIGSELCRQIIKYNPKKLIIFDIYENSSYSLEREINTYLETKRYRDIEKKGIKDLETKRLRDKEIQLIVNIGSVRDKSRLDEIFTEYRPDVVFHAAAHKHVPLMEHSPKEAIKNNVFGTLNLVKCANEHKVDRFILISTDKAVNPTNVMGATKRICEMLVQAYNKVSETKFAAVRFGNVLGSNGSVVPLFREQIRNGGPVTVTHEKIERYFMTIPEASQLVLQAGSLCNGGEIFVLDMGEPVKILNLAEKLIRLSGYEPYDDIDIVFNGLRPGEKLYEELTISLDDFDTTTHEKIGIEKTEGFTIKDINDKLDKLNNIIESNMSNDEVKQEIKSIIPEFRVVKTT